MNTTNSPDPQDLPRGPDREDPDLLLCDYLDGDLSRRERLRLERRIKAEEPLRDDLRRYGMLSGLIDELAEEGVEGVDYDLQRAEIISAIERKALLNPPRRRAMILRPRFWVTAAAASILLAVSAGLLVFGLYGGPADVPVAEMVMSGGAPAERGRQEISVQIAPPDLAELPIEMDADPHPGEPAGTIAVSFGAPSAGADTVGETMVVY